MDRGGQSDPYIVLAFAKFGKPLYSTRVIVGDLNPVWEETAFLLVTDDEVKGEELLSATLWDSDKRTADDLVGRVSVPLDELMKEVSRSSWRAVTIGIFTCSFVARKDASARRSSSRL
jgi:Ca2+-dependent lipid-binding protein